MSQSQDNIEKIPSMLSFIFVIVIVVVMSAFLIYVLDETEKHLQATHNQTEYTYQIISINRVNVLIGNDYYRIDYIDDEHNLYSLEISVDELKRVMSNESKLIIRNPEIYNGWPLEYIAHWNWR